MPVLEAITAFFTPLGAGNVSTAVALTLLVSFGVYKGVQGIFGGASPVPLADLDAEMKTFSTKLQKMTSLHPSITDDKDFLLSAIEGEFKTFEANVLATYPQFFVEGKLIGEAKRDAEYKKIGESLKDKSKEEQAKFKWQTVDRILVTYANCVRVVASLPKNADELGKAKQAMAEFVEQQRLAEIAEQERLEKLNNQNNNQNDQNDQTNNQNGQNGQTNGQNGTNNNNGTNGSSNNDTGKPKPSTTPTKNDKKKEGMAWYWWLVIIVGILSVLGAVAYLFLGTDPANDEEYSPEQEA